MVGRRLRSVRLSPDVVRVRRRRDGRQVLRPQARPPHASCCGVGGDECAACGDRLGRRRSTSRGRSRCGPTSHSPRSRVRLGARAQLPESSLRRPDRRPSLVAVRAQRLMRWSSSRARAVTGSDWRPSPLHRSPTRERGSSCAGVWDFHMQSRWYLWAIRVKCDAKDKGWSRKVAPSR